MNANIKMPSFVKQFCHNYVMSFSSLLATGHSISALEQNLQQDFNGFPVINSIEDMEVIGYVDRHSLSDAIQELRRNNQFSNDM